MDRELKPKRRRRDPESTRKEILEAALRCFAARGFAGTSIADIAKEAGVQKALVQYHFGTKEQTWQECLVHRAAPMLQVMDRFIKGEVAADSLVRARIDLHEKHPEVGRLFAWASMEPVPIPDEISARKDGLIDRLGNPGSPEALRFLMVLAMVDGWFLFRNLYTKLVGDAILSPEADKQLAEVVAKAVSAK